MSDDGTIYRESAEALEAILGSPMASDAEVAAAKGALAVLHDAWDRGVEAEFAARTAQYNLLVAQLRAVSAAIVTNPLVPLRNRLNQAIERAKAELAAAAEAAFAGHPPAPAAVSAAEAAESPHAFGDGSVAALPEADDGDPPVPAAPAKQPGPDVSAAAAASPVPDALYKEYAALFESCLLRADAAATIAAAANRVAAGKATYQPIAADTGVAWWVIGLIHEMECRCDFNRHLHNGDPLDAPTVRVPKGRPPGTGPFSFADSAKDALTHDKMAGWTDWSIPAVLYKLERYNGWGYRKHHPEVLTPYLWSFTNHYTKGKYVADGRFDANAVSKQVGAAAILRQMANDGALT